jgi:hypothetical protein
MVQVDNLDAKIILLLYIFYNSGGVDPVAIIWVAD